MTESPHHAPTPAGPGKEIMAGPGSRQGLWLSYGARDGLPYVIVDILQDSQGMLWLATGMGFSHGVFRFDGAQFTQYTADDGLADDNMHALPLDAQVKLLRLLEEHTFERVGGNRTLEADVRVVAATNRDLEEMVERETFRADLYYRLEGFLLRLPPCLPVCTISEHSETHIVAKAAGRGLPAVSRSFDYD